MHSVLNPFPNPVSNVRQPGIYRTVLFLFFLLWAFNVQALTPDPMVMEHNLVTTGSLEHLKISQGGDAGPYQAFSDAGRLANGDIAVVFYTGYGHVSLPKPGWEKGGRICIVTSSDEGRNWSLPRVIFDDERDNRDPHLAQLSDGTIVCTFFSLARTVTSGSIETSGAEIIKSIDGGATWEIKSHVIAPGWYVSAPVRQLSNGRCVLGLYHFGKKSEEQYGGAILSDDLTKTWSEVKPIGKEQGVALDAETDVIELRDGRLLAALRSNLQAMHYSYSLDKGYTWQRVKNIGFRAHSPHLIRARNGAIIMTHRLPDTAMHISRDETATWEGPYLIDNVRGAYPATVELQDGTFLVIYYTEGQGSHVRAKRFKLTLNGPVFLPFEEHSKPDA